MTLLSNSFIATPSTVGSKSCDQDSKSVQYWPSTATTSTTTINGPTPSQILAMTIRKKRKILRRKDRDLRLELLLTSTIRRLCQDIGDQLRTRRIQCQKRKEDSSTVSYPEIKRSRLDDESLPMTKNRWTNNKILRTIAVTVN